MSRLNDMTDILKIKTPQY